MNNRDFKDIGDEIKDIVQDAIGTNNYQHLNDNISRTIYGALNEVKKATSDIKKEFDYRTGSSREKIDQEKHKYEYTKSYNDANSESKSQEKTDSTVNHKTTRSSSYNSEAPSKGSQVVYNKKTRSYERKSTNTKTDSKINTQNYNKEQKIQTYNKNSNKLVQLNASVGNVSSILFTVFGAVGSFAFGITSLVFVILEQVTPLLPIYGILMKVFFFIFVLFLIMLMTGRKIRNRIKRFHRYVQIINGRNYCMIKEIMDRTEYSRRYIISDIKKMIEKRMFVEGHMDENRTCLMLNQEAYDWYISAKSNMELRQRDSKSINEKTASKNINEDKVRETNRELDNILKEGQHYILDIRKANHYIIDVDVSIKLDRMEQVTIKIFNYIENNPKKVKEIRRFMEYYLPTTIKLLHAYIKFDEELIQGDNIKTAKLEIIGTLDTINIAFENLLDDLYEDEAMDISTDISVLETMLMQEGLTGKDFDLK